MNQKMVTPSETKDHINAYEKLSLFAEFAKTWRPITIRQAKILNSSTQTTLGLF